MHRVPEPELMDDPAQARAYAEADFSEPHDLFVARFRAAFPDARLACRVLDLGCGPADVTIRFARACPECRIDGVDGAEAMLAHGREAVARAGLGGRIRLVRGRLPGARLPASRYGALISNSLLHHLADPGVLWRTVKDHGAAGAFVFVMDLMRPESVAAWEELVARHTADAPDILRRDFRASLAAAYRPEEVRAQLHEAGLGHFLVEAVSDRHLAAWGRLP